MRVRFRTGRALAAPSTSVAVGTLVGPPSQDQHMCAGLSPQ